MQGLPQTQEGEVEAQRMRLIRRLVNVIQSCINDPPARPFLIHKIISFLRLQFVVENEEAFQEWRTIFKSFLALKAKKWTLDSTIRKKDETIICKICERKIPADKIKDHSTKCLRLQKSREELRLLHLDVLPLSEMIFKTKNDLTIKSILKKYRNNFWSVC